MNGLVDNTMTTTSTNLRTAILGTLYSIGLLYLGLGLGLAMLINEPLFRSSIEMVPIVIGTLLLARYAPQAVYPKFHWALRSLFLALPFALLSFAGFDIPDSTFQNKTMLAILVIEVLAIGVNEELVFRYNMHRYLSAYGPWIYTGISALIFALAHIPVFGLGQVTIISFFIGVIFSLARVAGMPLVVLILLHALFDAPSIARFHEFVMMNAL